MMSAAQALAQKVWDVAPVFVLSVVLLAFVYRDRVIFTPAHRDEIYDPPGALPLIGHTYDVVKRGVKDQLETQKQYSDDSPFGTFRLSILGIGSVVFINRPEYLEYVQKTNFDNYPKGRDFRERLGDLLGHGIFNADGDVWRTQRKSASHMFSARKFSTWVRLVVHSELSSVVDLLDTASKTKIVTVTAQQHSTAKLKHAQTRSGSPISMTELFFRYTLSSFAKMAFDADLDCLTAEVDSLQRPVPFAVAFDQAQSLLNERFITPWFRVAEYFSGKGKRLRQSIDVVKCTGREIISRRLKELDEGPSGLGHDKAYDTSGIKKSNLENEGKDLLALFMEKTRDEDELLTVVLNFIIAGRDTTAQTLSWLFYELCANPENVDEIRKELAAVLGPNASQERQWLKYEDVKKLPYTLACVHEAARLHPPVPKNGKEVLKDDIIIPQGPNSSGLPPIRVYKGELIGWSDWAMNRSEAVWGAEAAKYDPKRFLSHSESQSEIESQWIYNQQSPWSFHVFNAGPRLCLGMNLANYEAVAFLAAVLPLFDFTWSSPEQGQTCDEWPPRYGNSLTHPMNQPYTCVITPREDVE